MMHPWHDLDPGSDAPKQVLAVIEIPKGSRAKFELHKPSGLIKLDRVLFSSFHYPVNYGMIPKTFCGDGDPLDILVICSENMFPGCLMDAKVIGAMRMLDNDEEDDKIIAVAANDISVSHIDHLSDIPPHFMREIQHFFEQYTHLEDKKVAIDGFVDREKAWQIIEDAFELYRNTPGLKP
jgi:inorganic pyrophosphatase